MKIAVDAMGGDYAPESIVLGVLEAIREFKPNFDILLVGDETRLADILAVNGAANEPRIKIIHASQVVGMDESPGISLKKKRNSSIAVSASLAKDGEADAIVSAGNTGAVVAATKLRLRFLRGVIRPAIATPIPSRKGVSVLLDAGANVDSKPYNLLQFAGMGSVYSKYIFGKENPTVAVLSIGEEESKGNELSKETFKLLKKSPLHFIGNIEGRDVFSGKADVIIADGFVGNIVLKALEGTHSTFKDLLKSEIQRNILSKIAGLLLYPALKSISKKADYEEYGGAPLLGVDGICIICHGSSSPKAIKNAVKVAHKLGEYKVNQHIEEIMEQLEAIKPALCAVE
ncbi:phosphate acyltransferase PlsX [bacterium]|nr:phosphate acyltransferase PlsX [bacterium]MCP5462496.1 phosphate acyltransferase PlsX [bacterium]